MLSLHVILNWAACTCLWVWRQCSRCTWFHRYSNIDLMHWKYYALWNCSCVRVRERGSMLSLYMHKITHSWWPIYDCARKWSLFSFFRVSVHRAEIWFPLKPIQWVFDQVLISLITQQLTCRRKRERGIERKEKSKQTKDMHAYLERNRKGAGAQKGR